MDRVLTMGRALGCDACGSSLNSSVVRAKAHAALLWWVNARLKGFQWWWDQIGEPEYVSAAAMLLAPLSADELAGVVAILEQTKPHDQDGQNLVWELAVDINRAVLTGNASLAAERFEWLWSAFCVHPGNDGMQPDGSFYFHGHLLQSGAYGSDFALNGATLTAIAEGTQFAASDEAFQAMGQYIAGGQARMVYTFPVGRAPARTVYDPLVKGREIVRPPNGSLSFPVGPMAWALDLVRRSGTDPAVAAELGALSDRIQGRPNATAPQGAAYFWDGEYASNAGTGFSQGLRVLSTRMHSAECVNGENQRGWHMAGGVVTTMRTATEYDGVFAAWDWDSLPGLSTVRGVVEDTCSRVQQPGSSPFVGGAVLGGLAVVASNYSSGQFASGPQPFASARKAWFLLPDGLLAVSRGLRGVVPGGGGPLPEGTTLSTSLEQRRISAARPEVYAGTSRGAGRAGWRVPQGNRTLSNATWVWHDGVVWAASAVDSVVVPAQSPQPELYLLNRDLNGSFHAIASEDPEDLTSVVPMLLARVDHSAAQAQSGVDFAYAVLPAAAADPSGAADALDAFGKAAVVVRNEDDATVLTYAPGGASGGVSVLGVAWEARASFAGSPAGTVASSVSMPCTLALAVDGKALQVAASDPAQTGARSLTFELDRAVSSCTGAVSAAPSKRSSGGSTLTVALPGRPVQGQTAAGACVIA